MSRLAAAGAAPCRCGSAFSGRTRCIIGVDIEDACKTYEESQISVRIGDQSNTEFLSAVCEEFGPPDIVLDDGSHLMSDVRASFDFLYPRVARSGVYVVEDMQTAYWPEFGGGVRRPESFMETAKNLIDALNADHSRGVLPPDAFTRSTLSMHFYDAMIVFEKGWHDENIALKTAGRT